MERTFKEPSERHFSQLRRFKECAANRGGLPPGIVDEIVKGANWPVLFYGVDAYEGFTCVLKDLELYDQVFRRCGLLTSGCLKTIPYPSIYRPSGISPAHVEISSRILRCGRRMACRNHTLRLERMIGINEVLLFISLC